MTRPGAVEAVAALLGPDPRRSRHAAATLVHPDHPGVDPDEVADFLLPYGWHVLEHVDSAELAACYIPDTGRTIQSTAIEPVVYAEKR